MKDELLDSLGSSRGPIINPLKYPQITCDKCGHNIFRSGIMFFNIPGFIAGTGTEDYQYPLPVYICDKCGEVIKYLRDEIDKGVEKAKKEESKGSSLIL